MTSCVMLVFQCINICPIHRVSIGRQSDIHRQVPTSMADIRRDWLTNQNTDWCFVVIDLVGRQSHSPLLQLKIDPVCQIVPHIGWHLVDAREYLLTSVASTVSRRIFIYIRGPITNNCCPRIWCFLFPPNNTLYIVMISFSDNSIKFEFLVLVYCCCREVLPGSMTPLTLSTFFMAVEYANQVSHHLLFVTLVMLSLTFISPTV